MPPPVTDLVIAELSAAGIAPCRIIPHDELHPPMYEVIGPGGLKVRLHQEHTAREDDDDRPWWVATATTSSDGRLPDVPEWAVSDGPELADIGRAIVQLFSDPDETEPLESAFVAELVRRGFAPLPGGGVAAVICRVCPDPDTHTAACPLAPPPRRKRCACGAPLLWATESEECSTCNILARGVFTGWAI